MKNLSSIFYNELDKYTALEEKELKNLSGNLEFKLLFNIDLNKPFKEAKKDFVRSYLNDLIVLSLGNVSRAAQKAGIHRRHLHRMINEFEIDLTSHRKELIKPAKYMKDYVQDVLEETLTNFEEKEKIEDVYSSLNDISSVVAENIKHIPYEEALFIFEREFIQNALKANLYDLKKTAKTLEISSRTLYRKLNKLGLVAEQEN